MISDLLFNKSLSVVAVVVVSSTMIQQVMTRYPDSHKSLRK